MIKCKCCGKEISEQAEICPHCGQPTEYKAEQERKQKEIVFQNNMVLSKIIVWIIIIIIIYAIIG